ncbi:MAG: ArnT family glycosyltransferase [Jatrophihabitantaceae bacterium]
MTTQVSLDESTSVDVVTPPDDADRRSIARRIVPAHIRTQRSLTARELTPILVVAAILRFVDLGAVGLNSDEAVYAGQSASLAGNTHFTELFPIVRAHPLLMQIFMAPFYGSGVVDTPGRYVAATFGVATVALVYVLGRVMYDHRVATVGALLMAVMPYHVIVGRQIMLDGPMAFFTTLALLCLALAARHRHRAGWIVAAGASIGLATLTKESAIIMIGSAFVFICLSSHLWRPFRFPLAGAGIAMILTFTYPVLTAMSGGSRSGQSYVLWQLTRQPNHGFGFYLVDVGSSIGFAVIMAAVLGLFAGRFTGRTTTWREGLLLAWILVPLAFFQIWPVKGYSYLVPLAPPLVMLAARALLPAAQRLRTRWGSAHAWVLIPLTVLTLAVPAVLAVARPATSGLAGAGGLPGGREVGRWVDQHVPEGAHLITIGPSMGNVIQFYSGRRCDALSVSPNPLHRNPTYRPIVNADAALAAGTYQYVVWDAYSAGRSSHFAARAFTLARRFDGHKVYTQFGDFHGRHHQPLVIIFEVHP